MSKINYRDCILCFLKIMLIVWWLVLGITITAVTVHATNWYMALIGLFIISIWVALSGTAVYLVNNYYEESEDKDE